MDLDRRFWNEDDERITYRRYIGEKYALDDPEILPHHLRELSAAARRQPSPRRKGKHSASDDQEGSRVLDPRVVKVVQIVAVAGLVIVGVRAVRGMLG